ncbi:hypothetical protein [Dethiothermospora halolimnae]|uniref:hypothetical protein n=1 Tax=Dethiothermospora halolimnae TaxID=3114390 RepID=UPI003CCBBFF1
MTYISLANESRNSKYKVYFIRKYQQGIDKIKEEKFEVIHLSYSSQYISKGFTDIKID